MSFLYHVRLAVWRNRFPAARLRPVSDSTYLARARVLWCQNIHLNSLDDNTLDYCRHVGQRRFNLLEAKKPSRLTCDDST